MSGYDAQHDCYMNTDTVAKYLMMSPNTIRKWVRKKQIPFIKVKGSKLVRFLKSEIDMWMRQGMTITQHSGEHNGRTKKEKRS